MSLQRLGEDFEKAIKKIQSRRMIGPDLGFPRPTSCARLTDAIVREPEWKIIEDKLTKAIRRERVL